MNALAAITLARKHDVTGLSSLHVILALVEDSPLRITDICERTGLTAANASLRVDYLRKRGWIIVATGRDRRTKVIIPSEKACQVFSDAV